MTGTIASYIQDHHLLSHSGEVLVAVSGGADSMALLHILRELGYDTVVLHCNFHLRNQESDRDEAFVRQQCRQMGVACHIRHFDTRAYASSHHISIEMAARDLRYQWFGQMREQSHAQAIAVAHHRDDQAETILLNLIRGTGIRGIAGMHPIQQYVVRPLLCISRANILRYMEENHHPYITDSSNLERDAVRNRIRLDVIPLLQTLNPNISKTLSRTAEHFSEILPLLIQCIHTQSSLYGISDDTLDLRKFRYSPDKALLLHEWLRDKGFTPAQEQEILRGIEGASGRMWHSPTHVLLHDRQQFLLRQDKPEQQPILRIRHVERIEDTSPGYAYVDADKVTLPLTVRLVHPGDRFVPFGMTGSRLVSDFLTDLKRSIFEKQNQWVACTGEEIVWVIGLRSDNRFRVDSSTRHILRLEINSNNI